MTTQAGARTEISWTWAPRAERASRISIAELAGDSGFVGQQAEGGAIEAVRFEREHGLFECLRIVEQGSELTGCSRYRNARLLDCRAKMQSPAQVVRR
jgi:hypothetical protein